jgi:hypothetical protein
VRIRVIASTERTMDLVMMNRASLTESALPAPPLGILATADLDAMTAIASVVLA